MIIKKTFFLWVFFVFVFQPLCAMPLLEQFKQRGYAELYDKNHGTTTFDSLYACFDKLIELFQTKPLWAQKLYSAKERFIRSKDRNYYSTDFFGFYDESASRGRNQISFYYATHFHDFICSHYPELSRIPEIIRFFEMCREIQRSYEYVFNEATAELGLKTLFAGTDNHPPILFKVVKYFPTYIATRPHYDGTAFSLFLDSTDNQSLLLSNYKALLTVEDFSSPVRKFARCCDHNSIVLIPGTFLTEFSIYPTPHIVAQSGNTRYAAIAFAMRPHHISQQNELSALPNFNH